MVLSKKRSRLATAAITALVVLVSLCLAQAPAQAAITAPTVVSAIGTIGPPNTIAVTWTQVTATPAVTLYQAQAYRVETGGTPVTSCNIPNAPATVTCTISGVSLGDTYWIDVTARNGVDGPAVSSPRVAVTTFQTAPSRPTNLNAGASDQQISVTWAAPASEGGTPVTSYTASLWSAPGGGTQLATSGAINALTATFTGLTNGQTYFVQVLATNSIGSSVPQSPRGGAIPATLPGPPTSLTASAVDEGAVVQWVAPASTGGRPITGYTARAWANPARSGQSVTCTTSGALNCTIGGLPNNVTYYVDAIATTAAGSSIASNQVEVRYDKPWVAPDSPTTTPTVLGPDPEKTPDTIVVVSPPSIVAFAPLRGPASGSTRITVKGTDFTPSSVVFIGGKPVQNLKFVDSQTLTGTTRGGSVGKKVVTVRDPKGNATAPATFRYVRAS